jgi:hypothetical protein
VTGPRLTLLAAWLLAAALLWQFSPWAVIVPAIVCGVVYVAMCAIGAALDRQDERQATRASTQPYERVETVVVDEPVGGAQ